MKSYIETGAAIGVVEDALHAVGYPPSWRVDKAAFLQWRHDFLVQIHTNMVGTLMADIRIDPDVSAAAVPFPLVARNDEWFRQHTEGTWGKS